MGIKLITKQDYLEMSTCAAHVFIRFLQTKPSCVLGLASGSTPLGLYKELIQSFQAGSISFAHVTTFNLDEYLGLDKNNPQSYRYYMQKHLFDHIDVKRKNIHIPNGLAQDLVAECQSYETLIEDAGGIDLLLLGLGTNGHIGFNEPDNHFANKTHIVNLKKSTREANSKLFSPHEFVPHQAISMGIGSIMAAKKILLLASGKNKAQAVHDMIYGQVKPHLPASILQFHQDVTVIVDSEAASLCKNA